MNLNTLTIPVYELFEYYTPFYELYMRSRKFKGSIFMN
ncbi:hypothetical protein LPL9_2840 [Lacticaseibacillus paracasei]|nr:hypothetical protein LPL9_2840 [Lacticaseibacillus paracasei]